MWTCSPLLTAYDLRKGFMFSQQLSWPMRPISVSTTDSVVSPVPVVNSHQSSGYK